jgi:hypothetical protein
LWEDNDTWRLVAGPFAVLALTRNRNNEAWGVLLQWHDHDGKTHRMAVARAALAGMAAKCARRCWTGACISAPPRAIATPCWPFLPK